jgi:protein TonB
MRPAISPYSSYQYHASLRSRVVAFVLAAGIVALLLFMLMRLGIFAPLVKTQQQVLATIQLQPGTHSEATKTPTPTRGKQAAKGASGARPTHVAPPVPKPKAPPPVPWNVMPLSSQEMAQADISTMPSHKAAAAEGQGDAGAGTGAGGAAAEGSGEGPGGAQLYNAEWYRKPTDAEMDTYMPRNGVQPGAWGIIACKTIPDYRVEDCRELGESPGSGMSRAMRQAAWQFRILPPRIGGKALIGAWVRIRYDIVARGSEGGDSGGGN